MSRQVPEAAVLVGVVLALSFAAYGLLFGDPLTTTLVSGLLLYAFVGYAVRVDEAPAATLRPDPVLGAAAVAGALALAYGLATVRPFAGLFLAVVLILPAALYHAAYAESVNPLSPDRTLALAGAGAALLLLVGVVAWRAALVGPGGAQVAGLTAGLVGLGAGEYHARRGGRLARGAERLAVATAFGAGLLALGYGLLVRAATTGVVVAVAALAVGAYFALVGDRRRGRRRGGRRSRW